MLLIEKEISLRKYIGNGSLIEYFGDKVEGLMIPGDIPVRFVV